MVVNCHVGYWNQTLVLSKTEASHQPHPLFLFLTHDIQAGYRLVILLPQPPEWWNYRGAASGRLFPCCPPLLAQASSVAQANAKDAAWSLSPSLVLFSLLLWERLCYYSVTAVPWHPGSRPLCDHMFLVWFYSHPIFIHGPSPWWQRASEGPRLR